MTTILVIEDEEAVRDNLLETLNSEQFEAVGAENGLVGLQLASAIQPDLILCDVMMPILDGFAVVQHLRQNTTTRMIPVIMLTAKTERSAQRQGMESGADDYLTKPCTPEELLRAIAIRLQRHAISHPQFDYHPHQESAGSVQTLQQSIHSPTTLLKDLSRELRNPLSNINMAIAMLQEASSLQQRDLYLQILQEEFDREIVVLNQVPELQQLLTPENAVLLRQFNLLKDNS